jgi:hypothetical protein
VDQDTQAASALFEESVAWLRQHYQEYEPSHHRPEFRALPRKLPVVFWGIEGVAKDVARIREFVEGGRAGMAFAVFVDEGRYFRHRPARPDAEWRDWDAAQPGDSACAASPWSVLAIGSGAIAVARTTAARWPRSGSWRRSGRRQG